MGIKQAIGAALLCTAACSVNATGANQEASNQSVLTNTSSFCNDDCELLRQGAEPISLSDNLLNELSELAPLDGDGRYLPPDAKLLITAATLVSWTATLTNISQALNRWANANGPARDPGSRLATALQQTANSMGQGTQGNAPAYYTMSQSVLRQLASIMSVIRGSFSDFAHSDDQEEDGFIIYNTANNAHSSMTEILDDGGEVCPF